MDRRVCNGQAAIALATILVVGCARAANPVPGDPLVGSGVVSRTANSYSSLMGSAQPGALSNESNFGLPATAAAPTDAFEGTLTLTPTQAGYFSVYYDQLNQTNNGRNIAPFATLPAFSFQFVQNGSYLIPVTQGLIITGSATWNYIIGPGRAWTETTDSGYTRAAFPFALVQRNQNCVHNGTMTFLFNRNATPNISHVAYQITGEGCPTLMFDMAGQVAARYTPATVANDTAIENAEATEVANRMPVKPFSALATDFPNSGFNTAAFLAQYVYPNSVTTYGVVINGINYNSGCATRHTASGLGSYPFCSEMRLPSYSTAKSAFSGLAMMRLGQLYGSGLYSDLIASYVPQYTDGGNWTSVTFGNTTDMATGNYISSAYESDENGSATTAFLNAEPYATKIADAFTPFPHKAAPGTVWVYQSVATFIQTQGLNAFLQQQQGAGADLFTMMSNDVYVPLQTSQGFQSTLRTGNSATGAPFGYAGLFYNIDDVAKIGRFVDTGTGLIAGGQVIDQARLEDALYRTSHPGLPVPDVGNPAYRNTWVYNHNFWGKKVTSAEFPSISCAFTVPFMSGYGGITIMPLPNGATYYVFDDAYEFPIDVAITQINKLVPYCP
ncbi:MAG TPA: hypothetical protein VHB68_02825 [Steroidobacteraceae bacterium]|nr:hypothetical protein [Steroidobacteraceae bacterium]